MLLFYFVVNGELLYRQLTAAVAAPVPVAVPVTIAIAIAAAAATVAEVCVAVTRLLHV